jgi:hypothetical protein
MAKKYPERKKIKEHCSTCATEVLRERKNKSGNYYCSYECRSKARKGPTVTAPCGHCGETLTRPQWALEKNASKKIFCTQKCAKAYNSRHRKLSGHKKVKVRCTECNTEILRNRHYVNKSKTGKFFCNLACKANHQRAPTTTTIKEPCGNCGKIVEKSSHAKRASKSGHIFCNLSCSSTYNHKHRAKSFRSKTEKYLEKLIEEEFPGLKIETNNCTYIGLELDLFMPQILFAIEVNGPLHYEPIYGKKQLHEIQERDRNKLEMCQNKLVDLRVLRAYELNKQFLNDLFALEIKPLIEKKITENAIPF